MHKISLAAARVNIRVNQKELAKMMGVSDHTIFNWENGKTSPSGRQLRKLSEIFGLPIDMLFLE